jgi:hypothetical protein
VSSTDGTNYTSALSYIPENPWNNSTAANGLLASNTAYTDSSGTTNIVAGGGGVSSLGTSGAGYAKPLWQQGFAPSNTDKVRDLPDVSLLAGNAEYGAVWALCMGSDCADGSRSSIHGVGGTSASAPAFAGILAIVNQKLGASTRLGQANWVLYKLAQTHPSAFHQITTGNISVYCSTSSPNCGSNSFLSGYNAGSGYNLATGLGSVDISALVNDWASDSLTATNTTLSLDKTTFTHGTSVNVTSHVTPAAATGDVAITNNYASQAQATSSGSPFRLALSNGSASGGYSQLPGGTYNVYANYGGTGTYAGSTSQPVQVTVSPEDSVLNFSADEINLNSATSAAGKTVPLGTFIALNAQPIGASQAGNPTPMANATGSVIFADNNADGLSIGFGNGILDSTGNAAAGSNYFPAGTHTITASYSGDLSYNASNAGPVTFTVSKAPTTITTTSSASSIIGGSLVVTANIAANLPVNANFGLNGTVTFTDTTSNQVLGNASFLTSCGASVTSFCVSAPLSVDVTQFAAGANNIVATYSGDSNFIGSGPSALVTVTCVAGCSNAAGQTLGLSFGQESSGTISAGGTITAVVSVSPGKGFTGAVNLTCSVAGKNGSDQKIPTCSFDPTQVNLTSTDAVSSTLTISTTAPTTSDLRYPRQSNSRREMYMAGGSLLAGVVLLGIFRRRFRHRYLLSMLILLTMLGWITACGGGASSGGGGGIGGGGGGNTTPGTSPDTYTITFHAQDAATGTVTAQDYFSIQVK